MGMDILTDFDMHLNDPPIIEDTPYVSKFSINTDTKIENIVFN